MGTNPDEGLAQMQYAPIAVFLYNRPDHTLRLFESLSTCPELSQSPVTVYCDGPKPGQDPSAIKITRMVARACAPRHAEFIEREKNVGLAESLTYGVSEQCEKHGKVIVLEDDLELSPVALTYFNFALDRYADAEEVMHIAGYMFPVEADLPEAFFYHETSCWGWATWKSAWRHFNPDAGLLLQRIEESGRMREFDVGGDGLFPKILVKLRDGKLDAWATRWHASVFLKRGLALHLARPVVANHGHDGTGVHCSESNRFGVKLATTLPNEWPKELVENELALAAMEKFRAPTKNSKARKPLLKRLARSIGKRLDRFVEG